MGRMKNLAELEDGKKLNGSNKEDQPVKVFWRLRRRIIRYENGKTRDGYFEEQLSVFDSTVSKRVQSYGSLYARSPVIHGAANSSKALTVLWLSMIQSIAKRLMKGMEPGHHSTSTTAHLPFTI